MSNLFSKIDPQLAKEYDVNEKVLQILACFCSRFTKSNIISVSAQLGHKMKNSKQFLEKYQSLGIITESDIFVGVSYYVVKPELWKDIITSIEPEYFPSMVKIAEKISCDTLPSFTSAVYYCLRGEDFSKYVEKIEDLPYFKYVHDYFLKLLRESSHDERLLPVLALLPEYYMKEMVEFFLQKISDFTYNDSDIRALEYFLQKRKEDIDLESVSSTIAFYHDFLRNADMEKAFSRCPTNSVYRLCLQAITFLRQENYNDAYKLFAKALSSTREKYFFNAVLNFYFAVTMINATTPAAEKKVASLLKTIPLYAFETSPLEVILLAEKQVGENDDYEFFIDSNESFSSMVLTSLAIKHFAKKDLKITKHLLEKVDNIGIKTFQLELSADFKQYQDMNWGNLAPVLKPFAAKEEWDVKLDSLLKQYAGKGTLKAVQKERIVYDVNLSNLEVQPKLQKSKDGITWTSGRKVSLGKFSKGIAEGMTAVDHVVASKVKERSYGWYDEKVYSLWGEEAVSALVGHPNVFDFHTGNRIEIIEEKPQIMIKEKGGNYSISSNVSETDFSGGISVRVEGNQIKVTKISSEHIKTIKTLCSLSFPKEAKNRLTQLFEIMSNDTVVMGDLMQGSNAVTTVKTHSETIVRLQPEGTTIRCQLLTRPFGTVPPICKPGKGMQVITTTIDGKQVQTKRNLKKEKENFEAVHLLMVDFWQDDNDEYVWQLNAEECLLFLENLKEMKGVATVEWPEGGQMKVVRKQLTSKDIAVKVNSVASWFELSGDIQVDKDRKLKISELVDRLSNTKGNFIQLGNNDYVRITSELRRHIDLLSRISNVDGGKMRISQFNAPMLEDLSGSGLVIDADKSYRDLVKRIATADTAEIKIPKTINADLRSYQKDGFRWMSRLSLWGAGALLADDMGLGKTLQAITLMLSRAKNGPQLVVVPTAVVMNWRDEILRFAPSLTVKILNTAGEGREALVAEAKEFDIVITTYGLLNNEEKLLTSQSWNSIVLDEAHTIKNRDTKMSQSAMKLKGDFRLLLTGTPLQNHVSEVWNLMQFANPNLLGSFSDFTSRFLLPIERDHDKERQRQLKRVVTPFILRRTKSEVLNELPEKTEITIKVDLSPDEMAYYDNIRQKALEEIDNKEATAMKALAEITRLRQAACNVRLVNKDLHIPSSKLQCFMTLVDELHTNNHRALVFSQFTSHLALIREELDKAKIQYLYLDGNTSAKERLQLVEQFQHGDMPLFLISLKAGGIGLNLTAADYVVHLDPWWNPAIEDQASDRAYRIGQHNPVTVYRIIASGTIEEKIIDLHKTKKNMADALLEGGDISASMSREEMLELLRSGRE